VEAGGSENRVTGRRRSIRAPAVRIRRFLPSARSTSARSTPSEARVAYHGFRYIDPVSTVYRSSARRVAGIRQVATILTDIDFVKTSTRSILFFFFLFGCESKRSQEWNDIRNLKEVAILMKDYVENISPLIPNDIDELAMDAPVSDDIWKEMKNLGRENNVPLKIVQGGRCFQDLEENCVVARTAPYMLDGKLVEAQIVHRNGELFPEIVILKDRKQE
jgi:hypothetical protein